MPLTRVPSSTPEQYRAAYRRILLSGPSHLTPLLAALRDRGHTQYDAAGLRRFVTGDGRIDVDGDIARVSPRSLQGRITDGLRNVLVGASVAVPRDALVRQWRAADPTLGSWVSDEEVEEIVEELTRAGAILPIAGLLTAQHRPALPAIPIRSTLTIRGSGQAAPLVTGARRWIRTMQDLATAVRGTTASTAFRRMRLTAHNADHHVTVDVAAVTLRDDVVLVVSAVLEVPPAGLGAFERRSWWFWEPMQANALGLPQARRLAQELPAGPSVLAVHVTREPADCADGVALALIASSLTGHMDLDIEVEQGPENVARNAARRVQSAQRRPTLELCGRCSLPLSDPASAERGYGPDCWEMLTAIERHFVARSQLVLKATPSSPWVFPLSVAEWANATGQPRR